jgi:radical SAM protein
MQFDDRPFIAIWETTQACDLVCKHCRACARPLRDPSELSTEEGKALLDSFADAGVPLVVLTGGDPAKRPDLLQLVAHGVSRKLQMGLTPSATPLVTDELIRELGKLGLSRLAISIDGASADVHDGFRGVPGSFEQALRILSVARATGITTQINTSIHAGSLDCLPEMAELVEAAGARLWSVFFVVPTGRATPSMLPSPERVEGALLQLADLAGKYRFGVKTTAAPHYRRVLVERAKRQGIRTQHGVRGKEAVRVNDGRGFLFISHRGEIFPSGFLPLSCGNIRRDDPLRIYREHPLFCSLRDSDQLHGKCGLCEYRNLCGGSRARAFGLTGDVMAEDPLCAYQPVHNAVVPREALLRRAMQSS